MTSLIEATIDDLVLVLYEKAKRRKAGLFTAVADGEIEWDRGVRRDIEDLLTLKKACNRYMNNHGGK